MKKIAYWLMFSLIFVFGILWFGNQVQAQAMKYDKTIQQTLTTDWIRSTMWELGEYNAGLRMWYWTNAVNTFLLKIAKNIVIPIIIFVWILLSLIWFYKILIKEWEEETKKWFQYILWWIVWVVIMVSAQYLTNILWWDVLHQWINNKVDGIVMSRQIYQNMVYPFLKLGFYLGMGVVFMMLIVRVFKFLQDDESTNSSSTFKIIIANIIGILIIIWWKQLVEAVYGKQDRVLNPNLYNLWQLWQWILASKNIPIIYEIIKRVMSLASFIVIVLLVYLGFKMLVDPENDEGFAKIKKNILYVLIWILVIWAWYLITNFLVVT